MRRKAEHFIKSYNGFPGCKPWAILAVFDRLEIVWGKKFAQLRDRETHARLGGGGTRALTCPHTGSSRKNLSVCNRSTYAR
jgi:hypothetical protein